MRWETQTRAVHLSAPTGRIGFDQLWLRLDQPTTTTGSTSSSTAAPGADACGSFID